MFIYIYVRVNIIIIAIIVIIIIIILYSLYAGIPVHIMYIARDTAWKPDRPDSSRRRDKSFKSKSRTRPMHEIPLAQ